MPLGDWNARRILRELCDSSTRQEVLRCFWLHGDDVSRRLATAQLAKSLRFREGSVRKLPPEKRADLLASRLASAEFEEFFEAALLAFHLVERKDLMAAFLDCWGIPHDDGAIEVDDYPRPTIGQVRGAVKSLGDRFASMEMILYLATAGLVMGEGGLDWREATWPVVEESITGQSDG